MRSYPNMATTLHCSRRHRAIYFAALLAVGFCTLPVMAAEKPVKEATPARQAGIPRSEVNGITQAAVNAGALACAGRINQVTNFLTAGSQSGAFLFAPPAPADQRMASVSIEINNKETSVAYASASFAPNQANGCGAVYEAVIFWQQKCDAVAGQQFAGLRKERILHKDIAVLEGGGSVRAFLMPAGSGCVSIKKEVMQ